MLAAGTAGVGAAGFLPYGNGRLWDKYLQGIRAIETGFPAGILRTFRTSEFLSPLESWSQIGVSAKEMKTGGVYSRFLKHTFGDIQEANLRRTGGVFGELTDETGKVRGLGIQIEAGTQKGTGISDYYARVAGVDLTEHQSLNDAILRNKYRASKTQLSYTDWLATQEPYLRRQRLILGARLREKIRILGHDLHLTKQMQRGVAKAEIAINLLRAKAASTAGRLNILLSSPLDAPYVGDIIKKVPVLRDAAGRMSVAPGTNLEFMSRFAKKAVIAAAAWKGLEYVDYLRAEGSPLAPVLSTAGGAAIGSYLLKGAAPFSKRGLVGGAALGLFAGIAPRFKEGIFHGAASGYTDVSLGAAKVSSITGATESLQRQEEITPGLVSGKAAVGFAGLGALAVGLGDYGTFITKAVKEARATGTPAFKVIERMRTTRGPKVADALWGSGLGKALRKIPGGEALTKVKSPMAIGAIAGLAAWQTAATALSLLSGNVMAAIPGVGLLGSKETPEELEDIYAGRQEVPVRKGRWWEFGRTPYEGGRIEYYRPHFMARLKSRAYQKGIYGTEEERWEHDPWLHPLKALFGSEDWKYYYEKKYQYERPAPLTSTYGEEIPFVGPIIASTFGKLFKPRMKIRPEEWERGGGAYVHRPDIRGETEPSYELGGLGPGAPTDPEGMSTVLNELNYRRREAVGLVGFLEGALTKRAIGREEIFQNQQTLATMGDETSSEYWMWDHLNLGGGMFTTEPIRRFIPRKRSYLETYNPLRNAMPSWMPDEYFLDLKYGNPFDKIKEAELRLPGTGYAALHPELEGVAPEDYPMAHKVKILGDVAMWSEEYKIALAQSKRMMNQFSDAEVAMIRETERQVKEKKKRRELSPYKFVGDRLEEKAVTVTEVLTPRDFMTKEFGAMKVEIQGMGAISSPDALMRVKELIEGRRVELKYPALEARRYDVVTGGPRLKAVAMVGGQDIGALLAEEGLVEPKELTDEFAAARFSRAEQAAGWLGEQLTHTIETPIEYLTPISPTAKMIHKRSPIEEYIATEAVGTQSAFWDRPYEHFLKPSFSMMAHKVSGDFIPSEVEERREILEYFDMLKWVKSTRLEQAARRQGREDIAAEYQEQKRRTVFGVDVFGSPVEIMKALPRRERDFFGSFINAQTERERREILSLIPDNERRIYVSQWMRQEEQAAYAKRAAKLDTENDTRLINMVSQMRKGEGFSYTPSMEQRYYVETQGQIPFDEWLRRKKAQEYFGSHSLPGADWIGWHPSVDLEDVKLQYVEEAGLDHHDFDLWAQRRQALARKPYINPQVVSNLEAQEEHEMLGAAYYNATRLGAVYGDRHANVNFSEIGAHLGNSRYNIEIQDGRSDLVDRAYRHLGA